MEEDAGSNMETIYRSKKKGRKAAPMALDQQAKFSENMQRKLRRLQEEEEKKKLRVGVMETLQL